MLLKHVIALGKSKNECSQMSDWLAAGLHAWAGCYAGWEIIGLFGIQRIEIENAIIILS